MPKKNGNRGSALVDWSTALSVMASAALAIPGVRTFVHQSHRSAVVNELQLEIRQATQAANRLGRTVTLCAAAPTGGRCGAGGNWSAGWLAFVDVDGDGMMSEREAAHELWRTSNSHPHITVAVEPGTLSFHPYYARPTAAAVGEARLTVCDREGSGGSRTIVVGRGVPKLEPLARECKP